MDQRREALRAYKENYKPKAGVMCVRNLGNGKIWVSSNLNLQGFFNRIRFSLERHSLDIPPALQADWDKQKPEDFSFEILDELKPTDPPQPDPWKELRLLEALWLDKLQPYGDKGYNPLNSRP